MRRSSWAPFALLALAGTLVYLPSLHAPFHFDDYFHIVDNPYLRSGHLWQALSTTTRPLVAMSLMLNYSLGGLQVAGFHLFNLGVHLLAAMVLFALLRKHLPGWISLAAALLWAVHPLQTSAVTYIIQRAELLMALFYLLMLYCLTRAAQADGGWDKRWAGGAWLACAAGMLSKPVMVSAPLAALLYDRIFFSSSWRELWAKRGSFYISLAATWGILGLSLMGGIHEYDTEVGPGVTSLTALDYLLTQPGVILHYLKLLFWPHPLLADYAWPIARTWNQILPPAILLTGLAAATLLLLRRSPKLGFLGLFFFLVLAPTSSILPLVDLVFEHRIYLPLAALLVLLVLGLKRLLGDSRSGTVAVCLLMGAIWANLTVTRNRDYQDPVKIWRQVIQRYPDSARAHSNLGASLYRKGQAEAALLESAEAIRLNPKLANAHANLGFMLQEQGRLSDAEEAYRKALELKPKHTKARRGMARLLIRQGLERQGKGNLDQALALYQQALEFNPKSAHATNNIGTVYFTLKDWEQAALWFSKTIELDPAHAGAINNLGAVYFAQGKRSQAEQYFKRALRLDPGYTQAKTNLEKISKSP